MRFKLLVGLVIALLFLVPVQAQDDLPAKIVLTMDTSGSMGGKKISNAKDGATDFVDAVKQYDAGDNDEVGLVSFDSDVTTNHQLTRDFGSLKSSIKSLSAGGSTSMWDGTYRSVEMLTTTTTTAKAVLLLTDGKDNDSNHDKEETINYAKSNDVRVFVIGVGPNVNEDDLRELADKTGGIYWHIQSANIVKVYKMVAKLTSVVNPPDAEITYTPHKPKVGETVTFDASKSSGPRPIVSYMWHFSDDMSSATGVTVDHAFTKPGNQTVILTVQDSAYWMASEKVNVNVTGQKGLTVYVHNAGGQKLPAAGGEIKAILYDENWNKEDEQIVSFSGGEDSASINFPNVAKGDYNLEIYQKPDAGLKKEEFWGGKKITVDKASEVVDFTRHTQVVYSVDKPTGLNPGDQGTIEVTLKNFENVGINSKAKLIVDKDKKPPWNYSETSSAKTVPANDVEKFSFKFTPKSVGTYHMYVMAKGEYDGDYEITDQAVWPSNWNLEVMKKKPYNLELEIIKTPTQYLGDKLDVTLRFKNKEDYTIPEKDLNLMFSFIDKKGEGKIHDSAQVLLYGFNKYTIDTQTVTVHIPSLGPKEHYDLKTDNLGIKLDEDIVPTLLCADDIEVKAWGVGEDTEDIDIIPGIGDFSSASMTAATEIASELTGVPGLGIFVSGVKAKQKVGKEKLKDLLMYYNEYMKYATKYDKTNKDKYLKKAGIAAAKFTLKLSEVCVIMNPTTWFLHPQVVIETFKDQYESILSTSRVVIFIGSYMDYYCLNPNPFMPVNAKCIVTKLFCPADLHFYGPQGSHVGLKPGGGVEKEVPNSVYITSDDVKFVALYNVSGSYLNKSKLTVEGLDEGQFELVNNLYQGRGKRVITTYSSQVTPNTSATIEKISRDSTLDIDLNRDGIIEKKKEPDSINVAPTVNFTVSPKKPSVNQTITFEANARDTDGSIVNYEWTFGSEQSASGATVTHSYTSPGTRIVYLTVIDDDGASVTASKQITIQNQGNQKQQLKEQILQKITQYMQQPSQPLKQEILNMITDYMLM